MIQHQSTPIKEVSCKFVKVSGAYRFFPATKYDTHRDAVRLSEVAEAAGILIEFGDHWVMVADRSTSLNIGCEERHRRELDTLIGKPERD